MNIEIIIGIGLLIVIMGVLIYLKIQEDKKNWEVIVRGNGTAVRGGTIEQDYEVDVIFIMEENKVTGERRAFIKTMDGTKQSVDVDWAIHQMKKAGVELD